MTKSINPTIIDRIKKIPTPMSGLALGIGSLAWSWENMGNFQGSVQIAGACIAAILLLALLIKFILFPNLIANDLQHPVVGSVVPTFAMALMVISKAVSLHFHSAAVVIWIIAVTIHLIVLCIFTYHRAREFSLDHMVPSWFVPPVGIIVAAVAFPGGMFQELDIILLIFGLVTYAILLPLMLYRFIFCASVVDAAKPTIAIMAAPASLSLTGYLTAIASPSPVIIALLGGISFLMTVLIYLAFYRLMQLKFSPAYAAFTFPMAIGATAMFKTSAWMSDIGTATHYVQQIHLLAVIELFIATLVIGYVSFRYITHYLAPKQLLD